MAISRALVPSLLVYRVAAAAMTFAVGAATCIVPAQPADGNEIEGQAPPNMAILKHAHGGAWFVAQDLKDKYDRLLDQVRVLQSELEHKGLSANEAHARIGGLRGELDALRREIESKKVLISPLKVHTRQETTLFDLGPEKLLLITGDDIVVEGWDGPQVKCVLEKTILAPGGAAVDEHFAGLKLIHAHGKAPEIVGASDTEREAQEQLFLASPEGSRLDERQRAARGRLLLEIAGNYAPYRAFQGREFDHLEIQGLTHDQGNRQVTVRVNSDGGGGNLGSDWQRHASLTVFVPRCRAVALRGCLVNLNVTDLNADLVVTSDGSTDRDYDGRFAIHGLHGSLTVKNAPLDVVDSITGNVTIVQTADELTNTGTQHEDNWRTLYIPPPRELVCHEIDGDFSAWFTRVDLKLTGIAGRIDVRNEFGETSLTVQKPLADKPHRLLSDSGRIELSLPGNQLQRLPVLALTNCGKARCNAARDVLEEINFTTSSAGDRSRRGWRGFTTANRGDGMRLLTLVNRLDDILSGSDRASGLDLVSRGGTVVVSIEK